MACTLLFITSLVILSAGIARFNKITLAKSVGVLCTALVYCVFCFIVFGKLQGFIPSQSIEQFISQHGYDVARLPFPVYNLIQATLIGGCTFNLYTALAIWCNAGIGKYSIISVFLFCFIGLAIGPVAGLSPIDSLFLLCCAFMTSVAWVLGLTYVEFCVIGNIWIPCLFIMGAAIFLTYASYRCLRLGMMVIPASITSIFGITQIISIILLLLHYMGTMNEAFYRCVQDLKYLATLAHTSYEVVNIFIWVFVGVSLLIFNIVVGRFFIKHDGTVSKNKMNDEKENI